MSGGRRRNRVAITYTDAELTEVEAAAERSGMAKAAWLGSIGLAAARSHEMPASDALRELLHAVNSAGAEAKRQGRNLNQVIAQLNTAGEVRPAIERHLQEALDQVTKALTEVNAAVRQIAERL